MTVDSIIQRIDAVLDEKPRCARPACYAEALPWLSPYCTPNCAQLHTGMWEEGGRQGEADRVIRHVNHGCTVEPMAGVSLAGAWLDEVDWARRTAASVTFFEEHLTARMRQVAEAEDQRPRHPACVDVRCRGSLVCRRTPCTVEPKQDREVLDRLDDAMRRDEPRPSFLRALRALIRGS